MMRCDTRLNPGRQSIRAATLTTVVGPGCPVGKDRGGSRERAASSKLEDSPRLNKLAAEAAFPGCLDD